MHCISVSIPECEPAHHVADWRLSDRLLTNTEEVLRPAIQKAASKAGLPLLRSFNRVDRDAVYMMYKHRLATPGPKVFDD